VGFYSIIAVAKQPVAVPDPLILLDRGRNVFTVHTEDLEELREKLKAEGVEIVQANRLDDHQPLDPQETLPLFIEEEKGLLNAGSREAPEE
jgi:hypothetical protein